LVTPQYKIKTLKFKKPKEIRAGPREVGEDAGQAKLQVQRLGSE